MIKIIEKLGKHIGIYAENLTDGKTYFYNHHDIFPSASVIKLPVLYQLFQNYISEKFSPDTPVYFSKNDYVEDSPWFANKQEGSYSLKDIAHSMITVSDNTATNLIISLLGLKEINQCIEKMGMVNTVLNRRMCDFETRAKGIENLTTPEDTAIFFKKLISDYGSFFSLEAIQNFQVPLKYNPANSSLEIIKIMTEQEDLEKIPSGIKGEGIIVANKPGELPDIRNDSALIIKNDKNYIICIFAEKVFAESEADALIVQLSAELFSYLNS